MLSLHKLPESVHFWHPATMIATGLGSGMIRPASGTFGSCAFFMAISIVWTDISVWAHFGVILGLCIAGFASIQYILQRNNNDKLDPSWIVIDEWAGLAVAIMGAQTMPQMLAGLVLFRVFDIGKPWPISWADKRVHGAFGVMLDDVIAGIITLIILMAFRYYGIL